MKLTNEEVKEAEAKKDSLKLPAWNTRLDEMTKGISQCTNEELIYLKDEIEKEIRLSNTTIKEGFE